MAEIRVKKLEPEDSHKKATKRELYALVCAYYPQYKLHEVAKLPARDVYLLIHTWQKVQALKDFNTTRMIAAPHSKKGAEINNLLKHFKSIIEG